VRALWSVGGGLVRLLEGRQIVIGRWVCFVKKCSGVVVLFSDLKTARCSVCSRDYQALEVQTQSGGALTVARMLPEPAGMHKKKVGTGWHQVSPYDATPTTEQP
jgi:hypothetical protein